MFIVLRPIRSEMKPQKITAKPQHELVTWSWFETTNCNFVAFSSNELAILPRLTFKNQTTEFGIDLEVSVNCQNLQPYKFSDEGFSATKKYGSKITNHGQLGWPFKLQVKQTPFSCPASDWFVIFCSQTRCLALSDPIYSIQNRFPVICH